MDGYIDLDVDLDLMPTSDPDGVGIVTTRTCCREWPIVAVPGYEPKVGPCGICGEVPE